MTLQKTRGQLERTLCQKIQALYRDLIGQYPSHAVSRLLDRKLIILLQDSSPPVEKFLFSTGHLELVERIQLEIETALRPRLKALVEDVLQVKVISLLLATDAGSGFSSVAVLLDRPPALREQSPKQLNQSIEASN